MSLHVGKSIGTWTEPEFFGWHVWCCLVLIFVLLNSSAAFLSRYDFKHMKNKVSMADNDVERQMLGWAVVACVTADGIGFIRDQMSIP